MLTIRRDITIILIGLLPSFIASIFLAYYTTDNWIAFTIFTLFCILLFFGTYYMLKKYCVPLTKKGTNMSDEFILIVCSQKTSTSETKKFHDWLEKEMGAIPLFDGVWAIPMPKDRTKKVNASTIAFIASKISPNEEVLVSEVGRFDFGSNLSDDTRKRFLKGGISLIEVGRFDFGSNLSDDTRKRFLKGGISLIDSEPEEFRI